MWDFVGFRGISWDILARETKKNKLKRKYKYNIRI